MDDAAPEERAAAEKETEEGMKFKLRWPRGRYNDRRIVGLSIKFQMAVDTWKWRPLILPDVGGFHWLCFRSWTGWVYE